MGINPHPFRDADLCRRMSGLLLLKATEAMCQEASLLLGHQRDMRLKYSGIRRRTMQTVFASGILKKICNGKINPMKKASAAAGLSP